MKYFLTISLLVFTFQFSYTQPFNKQAGLTKPVRFCVISDVHFYDTTLGTSGKAMQAYIADDPIMVAQSEAIFESALNTIKQEKPDFLLITGDLTKDGEEIDHRDVANYLKALKSDGIQTYIIPGNHDISNYRASSYSGDTTISIANVNPQEFASIYADFGYNQAIAKDTSSLSYVIEPAPGLWIIAMDACRYKENSPIIKSTTGGKFSANTLAWIEAQLQLAKEKNKVVIGMVHHGILEHFTGEKTYFPDFVIDDYKSVDSIFTKYDMRLVFTGHYHAQDITGDIMSDGKTLYDVETGSLVTYPCPYRVVTIDTNLTVTITSNTIKSINSDLGGKTFPDFASNFLITGTTQLTQIQLALPVDSGGYGISPQTAALVSPIVAQTYLAHNVGDENPSPSMLALISLLEGSSDTTTPLVGKMLKSFWTDLPPADNNVQFDIKFQTTAAVDSKDSQPAVFRLSQNFPNPFNPSTIINYQLPKDGIVTLNIFNILGQEIKTLVNGYKTRGTYNISFNGSGLASGMYFYQLRVYGSSGNFSTTRKMLLIK
jgi:3',5'-cyclic AMP phosphodiesterase CpdA